MMTDAMTKTLEAMAQEPVMDHDRELDPARLVHDLLHVVKELLHSQKDQADALHSIATSLKEIERLALLKLLQRER